MFYSVKHVSLLLCWLYKTSAVTEQDPGILLVWSAVLLSMRKKQHKIVSLVLSLFSFGIFDRPVYTT